MSIRDHRGPEANDFFQATARLGQSTRVAETRGKYTGKTELLLNPTQEHQIGVGTHFRTIELEQNIFGLHGDNMFIWA